MNIERLFISSARIAQCHASTGNLSGAKIAASVLLNHARRIAVTGIFTNIFLCALHINQ